MYGGNIPDWVAPERAAGRDVDICPAVAEQDSWALYFLAGSGIGWPP